jgi:prepilin-type N-terminal cleavage/methylation domain-containing protein
MKTDARTGRGFTLVELLVVIAIIAIMTVMLFPAIGGLRESARRTQCMSRVTRLSIAMQEHETGQGHFPAGVLNLSGPVSNEPNGDHHNWIVQLLPYLDESALYRVIDQSASVYAEANADARMHSLPAVICPSNTTHRSDQFPTSSYAGLHHDVEAPIDTDQNGVFFLNRQLTQDEIPDGLAYTIFLGEKLRGPTPDLGWMSGTRATLRNTGWPHGPAGDEPPKAPIDPLLYVGGFGSMHPGGAVFAFGDGRVTFLSFSIDPNVYQRMGHRDDGGLVDLEQVE